MILIKKVSIKASAIAVLACSVMGFNSSLMAHDGHSHQQLAEFAAGEHRSPANIARNQYRNPAETLEFFELSTQLNVVEIWPGGGWYSEILAPYLRHQGKYTAAHFDPNSNVGFFTRSRLDFQKKLEEAPELYQSVSLTSFFPPKKLNTMTAEADRVFTFRNVHNWMKSGFAEQAFVTFFTMLKPGGLLGVVEHRAKPGTDLATMIKSGYVTEAKVIALAEQAGFKFLGSSQINSNEKDSANHPRGVWSLPPRLALGETDKPKYQAIGESDRMTLKFLKPIQ